MLCALIAVLLAAPPPSVPLGELEARRDRLRAALAVDDVAVVLAADRADDFRQEPGFTYLAGLRVPGAAVLIDGGSAAGDTMFLPPPEPHRHWWVGDEIDPGGADLAGRPDPARRRAIDFTGFPRVQPRSELVAHLLARKKKGRVWLDRTPAGAAAPVAATSRLERDLRRHSRAAVADLKPLLRELRAIKSPVELGHIRRAAAITIEAHYVVARSMRPGLFEYEVRAEVEYVFARAGARRPAFPSIVGSGINGTILHDVEDDRRIGAADLVVVDIGAEWHGYAADISRTFPASGRFDPRQREVYDIVLRAQDAALAAVRPGAHLTRDVHGAARRVIDAAGFAGCFPHGTSHHVGLEVHDPAPQDGILRAGMVITVEPGIYLRDEGFGIRVEDLLVVTAHGYQNLTAALPRAPDEVERWMADAPHALGPRHLAAAP